MYLKVTISKVDDYKLWCERHNCEVDVIDISDGLEDVYGTLDLSNGECRSGGMTCFPDWYIVFTYQTANGGSQGKPWEENYGYHTAHNSTPRSE